MRGQVLQRLRFALRWSDHRRCVASKAADAWVAALAAKALLAMQGTGRERYRLWCIQEAHENCKHLPVREFVQGIVESLVAVVRGIVAEDIVRFALIRRASWAFINSLGKQVVGDAHFHVVGFPRKYHDRFILGLPAEARDSAVVAAAIGNAVNAELVANFLRCVVACEDFTILDAIEYPKTKQLQWNAEAGDCRS